MLVYLKEPMGIAEIDGVTIAGKYYNYGRLGAKNVPYLFWRKHNDKLEQIPITRQWLEKKTGKKFPLDIPLTKDMSDLDWHTLLEMASLLGIDYRPTSTYIPSGTDEEQRGIKKAIFAAIDALGD